MVTCELRKSHDPGADSGKKIYSLEKMKAEVVLNREISKQITAVATAEESRQKTCCKN